MSTEGEFGELIGVVGSINHASSSTCLVRELNLFCSLQKKKCLTSWRFTTLCCFLCCLASLFILKCLCLYNIISHIYLPAYLHLKLCIPYLSANTVTPMISCLFFVCLITQIPLLNTSRNPQSLTSATRLKSAVSWTSTLQMPHWTKVQLTVVINWSRLTEVVVDSFLQC